MSELYATSNINAARSKQIQKVAEDRCGMAVVLIHFFTNITTDWT